MADRLYRVVLDRIPRENHGQSRTPLYRIWGLVKNRCHNPNATEYERYGGRGIKMCDRWYNSFAAFAEDMGTRPSPDHSLDRIDNDGPYSPENCRWATASQQARNRSNTLRIDHDGESLTLAEWSERTGIKRSTLSMRYYSYQWSVEQMLTTPTKGSGPHR